MAALDECPQLYGSRRGLRRIRASAPRSEDRSFDRVSTVEHPSGVSRLVQRLAALALAFGLVAGNAAAICAGWLPTPEARMACCADGVECPMHKGDSQRSGSARVLTQAQVRPGLSLKCLILPYEHGCIDTIRYHHRLTLERSKPREIVANHTADEDDLVSLA